MSSLAVAGGLALLMVTSVMPPIIADQSDRAIIDAPVLLLTAPIEGDLGPLPTELGEHVNRLQLIAQISNSKVDRSTLLQLEQQAQSARERMEAAKLKRDSDQVYLSSLDQEISRQKAELESQFQHQITELQSRVDESLALSAEKKALVDQQRDMVARNVLSPALVKRTAMEHAASIHASDAERSKLAQKKVQLNALQRNVYVGDTLAPLAELAQKRRDIQLDAKRMDIERGELQAVAGGLDRMIVTEKNRIADLTSTDVVAPSGGKLLSIGAAAGRHVKAGDTLASLVDCQRKFVVAIFSYRQGQSLSIGSHVKIDGAPFKSGIIKAVVPKTSDKLDEHYAVPFPQTERRELYAIIGPDAIKDDADREASDDQYSKSNLNNATSCAVGKWVTVTLTSGAVPSMSVTWTNVENFMTSWSRRREAPLEQSALGVRKLAAAFRDGKKPELTEVDTTTHWLRHRTDVAFQ